MAEKRKVSRRKFIRGGSAGALAAALTTLAPAAPRGSTGDPASKYDRALLISRLGDTLIPSGPDDPGYSTLEPYNITAEVMKGLASLPDDYLALFNTECAARFDGRTFVELPEEKRAEYLNMIADGAGIPDPQALQQLQSVYRLVRARVFVVFYQNYPQHILPRDKDGFPIFPADDQHQITNPNQPGLVTGWDIAGWVGPMTWEEEEQRREHFKKVRWKES